MDILSIIVNWFKNLSQPINKNMEEKRRLQRIKKEAYDTEYEIQMEKLMIEKGKEEARQKVKQKKNNILGNKTKSSEQFKADLEGLF